MGIFNLVFRILGATPRVWFAPSGSDGLRAAAGTAGRAHACVTRRGGGGGRAVGPLAPPGPPWPCPRLRRTKWPPGPEHLEPQGEGKWPPQGDVRGSGCQERLGRASWCLQPPAWALRPRGLPGCWPGTPTHPGKAPGTPSAAPGTPSPAPGPGGQPRPWAAGVCTATA